MNKDNIDKLLDREYKINSDKINDISSIDLPELDYKLKKLRVRLENDISPQKKTWPYYSRFYLLRKIGLVILCVVLLVVIIFIILQIAAMRYYAV